MVQNIKEVSKEIQPEIIDLKCRSAIKNLLASQDDLVKKIARLEVALTDLNNSISSMNIKQEPMSSEHQDKLFEALCKAKAGMTVNFEKTGSSNRGYFATYPDLVHHAKSFLAEQGVDIIHEPIESGNQDYLRTTVTHVSGQWRSSICAIRPDFERGSSSPNQAYAAALTSMKRYVYGAILNLHTGGDKE
ncbi:MAG: ERF family protein [bacterium]